MCGWATHGAPTDTNAHPHMSNDGRFAIVHNGIIENYLTLRDELQQKGYHFESQTDTEVVAVREYSPLLCWSLYLLFYTASIKFTTI